MAARSAETGRHHRLGDVRQWHPFIDRRRDVDAHRWPVRLPAYRVGGPPVIANGMAYAAELSSFVDTTVRAIRLRDGASLARVPLDGTPGPVGTAGQVSRAGHRRRR
ncbi:hypothetical protein GCM10028781_32530 [Nostocoides australiense]